MQKISRTEPHQRNVQPALRARQLRGQPLPVPFRRLQPQARRVELRVDAVAAAFRGELKQHAVVECCAAVVPLQALCLCRGHAAKGAPWGPQLPQLQPTGAWLWAHPLLLPGWGSPKGCLQLR